jgi:hypothetical protein
MLVPGARVTAQQGRSAQSSDEESLWYGAVVASTLGLGVELSGRSNPVVGLRGGYFLFGMSRSSTISGINYDLKPRLRNGTLMLDLFPGGKVFRVSGGVIFSGTKVGATGQLSGPVQIGDQIYPSAAVGSLTGEASYQHGIIPYAGIGFSSTAKFTVTFDLGVGFSGYPQVRLSADSPLTGTALEQLQQSVAAEQAQAQAEVESHSWAKYYPVISIGFKFRF